MGTWGVSKSPGGHLKTHCWASLSEIMKIWCRTQECVFLTTVVPSHADAADLGTSILRTAGGEAVSSRELGDDKIVHVESTVDVIIQQK